MVGSSKVRIVYPSISFLFTCLGASLGVSRSFCPLVKGFVFGDSSLNVVLAGLFPLLRQSADWFEDLMGERRMMSEVRSSKLETGLSSRDDLIEVEEDTAAFGPREVRAFSALGKECGLNAETLSRFRDRFQFPERVRARHPHKEERACHFLPRKGCFYEAAFQCGLRFPIHPSIMELLSHFNIVLGQLMPNSWRIVVSCMEIWLVVIEGNMIRVFEFIYLYRLKESKEYGYYELIP